MSFGLVAKNNQNQVTVDADYRNLVLREKITQSFSPSPSSGGGFTINVDRKQFTITNAINPVCFIVSSINAGFTNIAISGTSYTWTISSNSSGTATAYIFDVPISASLTYGINVFDGSSNLVFSSDYKYMRVIDTFDLPNSGGNVTRSYTNSGVYAVGIGIPRTIIPIAPFNIVFTDGVVCNTNSISINYQTCQDNGNIVTGLGYVSSGTCRVLVADVTGY